MPARSRALGPTLSIANDAQRNTALPCMIREASPGLSSAKYVAPVLSCRIRSVCSPSEPQTTGPMPGLVGRSDHRRAGAVGEDERRAGRWVEEVGEPLHADHQHVLALPARTMPRRARARGRSRRKRRRCRTRRPVGPELVGDRGGDGRGLQHVASRSPRSRSRSARRRRRRARAPRAAATDIICTVSSGVREAALLDAGAVLDPLVAGVDAVDDLGVGDDAAGAGSRRSPARRRTAFRRSESMRCPSGFPLRTHRRVQPDQAADRGRPGRRPPRAIRRSCRRAGRSPGSRADGNRADAGLPVDSTSSVGSAGGRCPCPARPASARSGWRRSWEALAVLSQNARASSSWSGVLRANVSTP